VMFVAEKKHVMHKIKHRLNKIRTEYDTVFKLNNGDVVGHRSRVIFFVNDAAGRSQGHLVELVEVDAA
jgi:hypothetical protein